MRIRTYSTVLLIISAVLFGLAVAACAPDTSAPEFVPVETLPPTTAALPEVVSVANAAGTPIATVPPFTDTACLDCHTDQQRLETLAIEPEEDAHSELSSGPG